MLLQAQVMPVDANKTAPQIPKNASRHWAMPTRPSLDSWAVPIL